VKESERVRDSGKAVVSFISHSSLKETINLIKFVLIYLPFFWSENAKNKIKEEENIERIFVREKERERTHLKTLNYILRWLRAH
jgi:hypothetical protein